MSERVEKLAGFRVEPFNDAWRSTRATSRMWSIAEIRLLRELAAEGIPMRVIAARLQRTASAVKNKAGIHGISVTDASEKDRRAK